MRFQRSRSAPTGTLKNIKPPGFTISFIRRIALRSPSGSIGSP
jgi:hypothetical protein